MIVAVLLHCALLLGLGVAACASQSALADHWNDGGARREIARGAWELRSRVLARERP
jgi:hypothetical protein